MNKKKALMLISLILAAAMLCACFAACSNKDSNNGGDDVPEGTQEAMITASPDGEVTASPTKEPGSDATDNPSATEAADNTEAASTDNADETARPGTTEAGATQGADETQGPNGTSSPITTVAPADPTDSARPTAMPIATPTPRPTAGPTAAPTAAPTEPVDPLNSPTCPPINGYEAHYAGSVEDAAALAAGDSFYWTLDLVNEHSRMWSGQWLVDYPEQYLKCDSYSATWSGGLIAQINETWDNETDWSDKPAIVCNPAYNGGSGGHPCGTPGNLYANIGMYLTSFDHYGVQMAGSLIRLKFIIKSVPANSQLKHDADGYYLELPVLVYESTAMIDAPADSPIQPYCSVAHGIVTSVPGKVYFSH